MVNQYDLNQQVVTSREHRGEAGELFFEARKYLLFERKKPYYF